MAHEIHLSEGVTKAERYNELLSQIRALVSGEPALIPNLSNIAAVLKEGMRFLWVGFYLVKGHELVLGPFQGPVACTRIGYGKGVCGTAWKEKRTIIVEDVETFPGHIACSSRSKSEIVIPAFSNGEVFLVLDVDSDSIAAFDMVDQQHLEQLIQIIEAGSWE